jgi:hypothetical protein
MAIARRRPLGFSTDCLGSAVGEPDWQLVTAGEPEDTANMIAVLVSDDNRFEIVRDKAKARQATLGLLGGEAAIEHDACHNAIAGGFNHQGVALASATKRGKTHRDYFS